MNTAQKCIESRFCKSIKTLIYAGSWPPDVITNPKHKIFFYVCALLWQSAMISAIVIQQIDLYFVLGNLKKMTFNLCSSAIVLGNFIKLRMLLTERKELTKIIYKLWEDSNKCNKEEDIKYLNQACDKMDYVRKILYTGVVCVVTIMSGGSYFSYKWGERILPFAGYFPMDDMNNDLTYVPALLFEFVMGLYAGITVLESDVMMLTLTSQIQAHYKILFKNLKNLDKICRTTRINRIQTDDKILKILKALVKRHIELLKYCEKVEHIFHRCMLVQLFAGSTLTLMNGVETARQMHQISLSLGYQMLFVLTVTFDLYIISYYFTALETECVNASFAAYSTQWYDMDIRVRKMLCIIMIRSQTPPRFTYGKLLKIDLNSYMHCSYQVTTAIFNTALYSNQSCGVCAVAVSQKKKVIIILKKRIFSEALKKGTETMSQNYFEYRFCSGFKRLIYMGMWTPDMFTKQSQKILFYFYAFLCQSTIICAIISELIDLYLTWGNFKKMTFNFCFSIITVAIVIKMILIIFKREKLRRLHYKLWEDSLKYNSEEDVAFLDGAYQRFHYIGKIYHLGSLTLIPIVGLVSYFSYTWEPRVLPFAAYIPFPNYDDNNDAIYVPVLLFEIMAAIYVTLLVVESDLVMLGAMFQVQAHCEILSKTITKLDQVYEKDSLESDRNYQKREINITLRNNTILKEIREVVKRHLEVLEYCENLEDVFNSCMTLQIIVGFLLIVMTGVETTREMSEVSLRRAYEIIYLIYLLFNLYIICNYFTKLATACTDVGIAAYNACWYNMNIKVRKSLWLIINRAQQPPKFTFGKLYIIDVQAYMHLIRNTVSWVMLFRQLEMK